MTELRDEPLAVITINEGSQCRAQVFDGVKGAPVDRLLLERADEAFGDTVRLGLTEKGEAGGNAPETQLLLIVVGEEL